MSQQTAFDIYPEGTPVWGLFDHIWYPGIIPSAASLGDDGLESLYRSVVGDEDLSTELLMELKRTHIPVYFLKDQTCSMFNVKDIAHFSMNDKDKIDKEEIKDELACLLAYMNVSDNKEDHSVTIEKSDSSTDEDDNYNNNNSYNDGSDDETGLLLGDDDDEGIDESLRKKREKKALKAQRKKEKKQKKKEKKDKRTEMKIKRENSRLNEESRIDTDTDREDSPDSEEGNSDLSRGLAHVGWKDARRNTASDSGSYGGHTPVLLSQSDEFLQRMDDMGGYQRSSRNEFRALKSYYHNVASHAAADPEMVMPIYECDFLRSAERNLEKRQRLVAYLRASEKRATDKDAKILFANLEKKVSSYSVEEAFTPMVKIGSTEFKAAIQQEKTDVSNKIGVEAAAEKKKHALGLASDAVDLQPVSKPVGFGSDKPDYEKLKRATRFQYLDPALNPLAASNGDVIAVQISPFSVGDGLERERLAAEKARTEAAKMNQAVRDGFGIADFPIDDEMELTRMVAPRLRASGVDTSSLLPTSSNSAHNEIGGGHTNLQALTQGSVSTFSDPFAKRVEKVVSLGSLRSERNISARMPGPIMAKWHAFRDLNPPPTQDLQKILPNGNGISAYFDEERMRLTQKARDKALHHLSKDPDIVLQQQIINRSSGMSATQNVLPENILSQLLGGGAASPVTHHDNHQDEKYLDQPLLRNTASQLTDNVCSNSLTVGGPGNLMGPSRGSVMTDFTQLQPPRRRPVPKPGHPDQVELRSVYSMDSDNNSVIGDGALYGPQWEREHEMWRSSKLIRGSGGSPMWENGVSSATDMLQTREGIIALANTQGAKLTEEDLHIPIQFGYAPSEVYRSESRNGSADNTEHLLISDDVDVGSVMSRAIDDSEVYPKSELPYTGERNGEGGISALSADADDGHASSQDVNSNIGSQVSSQHPIEVLKALFVSDARALDSKIRRLLKEVEARRRAADEAGTQLTAINGEHFFISFTAITPKRTRHGACFPASKLHDILAFLRTPTKLKEVVIDMAERCLREKERKARTSQGDPLIQERETLIFKDTEKEQIRAAFRQKIERMFSLLKGSLSTASATSVSPQQMKDSPFILFTRVIDADNAANIYTQEHCISGGISQPREGLDRQHGYNNNNNNNNINMSQQSGGRRPRERVYGQDHD